MSRLYNIDWLKELSHLNVGECRDITDDDGTTVQIYEVLDQCIDEGMTSLSGDQQVQEFVTEWLWKRGRPIGELNDRVSMKDLSKVLADLLLKVLQKPSTKDYGFNIAIVQDGYRTFWPERVDAEGKRDSKVMKQEVEAIADQAVESYDLGGRGNGFVVVNGIPAPFCQSAVDAVLVEKQSIMRTMVGVYFCVTAKEDDDETLAEE